MPCSGPIYYSNESKIGVAKGAKFVHGDLDLLIGEMTAECYPSIQVSIDDDQKFDICRPELSETKCGGKGLAKKVEKPRILDLSTTIQPVLQLIVMGQLLRNSSSDAQHLNFFYMNRHKIRPFIYFPSHDVMLSTQRSYVWRKDDQLMLRGCILIALLLRLQQLARIPSGLWTAVDKTRFVEASIVEKVNFQESFCLKLTHFSSKDSKLDVETKEEAEELQETKHPNLLSCCNVRDIYHF